MTKWVMALIAALVVGVPAAAEPLSVFVSVLPLKGFVERIGGQHVEARVMVRPGQSPDTYAPTPKQIGALAHTALYVSVGVPFEKAWMKRIRAANPRMRVVDARAGIDLRTLEHHDHGQEHEGIGHGQADTAQLDPHVWTSPPLVIRMARNIRDALTELDPEHGPEYARNCQDLVTELEELDRDIRNLLKDLPERKFLVFHPAWGYFADTYGLTQVAIEREGKEPGARALTALIDQARREGVRVVFVQPQFSRRSANRVAQAIDGRVVSIDPLAPDYAENLRRVARQIAGETPH